MVDNLNCDFSPKNKLDGKGYGFLPEHDIRLILFEECTVDLIGPWTVQVRGRPYKFEALTVIDTVSNLVELPCLPGHKHHLKDKVQRSKSSLFSCRIKCQECMGSTFLLFLSRLI